MISRRRLAFQLTPLLDLLLIVMFAQYLEVRLIAEELAEKRAAEKEAFERSQFQQQQILATTREQRDAAARLMSELFRVPEATLAKVLHPARPGEAGLTPADVERIRNELRSMQQRPEAILQHLLTYDELRKRTDLWELHIDREGIVHLRTAGQDHEMRGLDPRQLAETIFQYSRTLPQPKSLVVLLATWDDVRFKDRLTLEQALPLLVDQLRADQGGRSRFEYAVLGYRPSLETP